MRSWHRAVRLAAGLIVLAAAPRPGRLNRPGLR